VVLVVLGCCSFNNLKSQAGSLPLEMVDLALVMAAS